MNQRRTDLRTSVIALGSLLVLLQVAGIAVVLIQASQKIPSGYLRTFEIAMIHRNELLLLSGNGSGIHYEIKAVDLQSGRERMTDYPVHLPWSGWVTDGKLLWLIGGGLVVEIDGERQTEYRPQRKLNTRICMPFLYDGLPALFDDDGLYHLLVFNKGEWEDRGEVALPGVGRRWETDEHTRDVRLVPLWKEPRSDANPALEYVRVTTVGNTQHLFHIEGHLQIVSYREGLEFVTRDTEIASATSPSNVASDVTGWKMLDFGPGYLGFCRANDGVLIANLLQPHMPIRFWEKTPPGSEKPFQVAMETAPTSWQTISLASTFDGKDVYFIQDRNLFSPRIRRYEQGELKEVDLPISTPITKWLHWTQRGLTQLAVVMSVGTFLMVCGSMWLSRSQESSYQFGHDSVRLAPIGRRCLARAIDLILLFSPLIVHTVISWPHLHNEQIFRLYWGSGESQQAFTELFQTLRPDGLASIVLFIVMNLMQSRWGVTPGKWLVGLRTLRTTLRPCGVARSLLRELLMAVDAPLLLTPLPGITSMLATDCRQRLGDLAADTLVIDIRGSNYLNWN